MPAPKVRSKDNAQQRLRDRKRQWNSTYKDFSQKLKAFKDGMNGRGNAKVGLPPSNIKEPMPHEIGSYLSELAGEFQTIVGDAQTIIAEQAQYAKTRRRRRPKAPGQPGPQQPSAAPEAAPAPAEAPPAVAENLARLGAIEYDLKKEASNKLTRFWQYITAIFSSKQYNRQRVGLLSQAADLYYSLMDLENKILSMNMSDIPRTVGVFKDVKYNLNSFVGTFQGVQKMMEEKAEEAGVKKPNEVEKGEKKPLVPSVQEEQVQFPVEPSSPVGMPPDLAKIKNDVHLLFNASLGKQQVQDLFEMLREYEDEDDKSMRSMWADRIKSNFEELVKHLTNEVQKRYGPAAASVRSVQDIVNLVRQNKKAEYISDYMEKTAHNRLTRALKRRLVKMRTSNKTAPVRLQIDEIIDSMKTTVKNIMNVLERDLSMEELIKHIESLEEDKSKLERPIHVLNIFYMKDFFAKDKKKKPKKMKGQETPFSKEDELVDYVLQRKLKRELSGDLT